jgi:hypothetical protein
MKNAISEEESELLRDYYKDTILISCYNIELQLSIYSSLQIIFRECNTEVKCRYILFVLASP